MNHARIDLVLESILQESAVVHDLQEDPRLKALRTAMLLEDVFDIVLTDDEIDPAVFSDPDAVLRLVHDRLRRR